MFSTEKHSSFGETDTIAAVADVDNAVVERVLVDTELTPKPAVAGVDVPASLAHETAPARFNIRLANSDGHRNDSSFLVRKMYGWRGYIADPAHTHPNCVTLIASSGEKSVATLTVGFDSDAGMAVGALYPEEVERLRESGGKLCEFTRLAVDRTAHSKELLAMMFHVAYIFARRLHGKTDLLIEVNPRHARFYERMLGFRAIGPERICPRVNAPAILMWLPLQHAEEQIARLAGRGSRSAGARSLYSLFFSPDEEAGITARLLLVG